MGGLATAAFGSWEWSLSQGTFYKIEWVANVLEEPIQLNFLLPTSLITAAMCVNSTEKSLDTTAFVATLVLAVEMENNDGVSFLTIGGCFEIPRGHPFYHPLILNFIFA